jgi:broad specificity phosphatase PhoE
MACLAAGVELAAITSDPVWNEFDLAAVYEAMAPRLAADDPEFRQAFEKMQEAIAANEEGVHRRWFPTDMTIVRAWIEGRYHFAGESWPDFKKRIAGGVQSLRDSGHDEPVAIFTSATPMAIAASLALGVNDDRTILKLAGACYNTSLTVLKIDPADLMLVQYNSIPHLVDPALRSFR